MSVHATCERPQPLQISRLATTIAAARTAGVYAMHSFSQICCADGGGSRRTLRSTLTGSQDIASTGDVHERRRRS